MAEASGGEGNCSLSPEASTSSDGGVPASIESHRERPVCILCLGMAGSGKTTFVQVHRS